MAIAHAAENMATTVDAKETVEAMMKGNHAEFPPLLPPPRDYGWHLKQPSSTNFQIVHKDNGQMCIVLTHSIVRGVTCEMIHFWFQHFCQSKVRLENVPGFEGKTVPFYWLWHPYDHVSATMKNPSKEGLLTAGSSIQICEYMQSDVHGDKFPVNSTMAVWLLEGGDCGGQGMGKVVPFLGPMIRTRIFWHDTPEGVLYQYEMVMGQHNAGPLSNLIRSKIAAGFTAEMIRSWNRHNSIEVGTFENFLPAIWEQRETVRSGGVPVYDAATMNGAKGLPAQVGGASVDLFDRRVQEYKDCVDAMAVVNKGPLAVVSELGL